MEHLMVEPELKEKILRQEPHKFVTLHRSSPQMTTGVTLLFLMCGRKVRSNLPEWRREGPSPMKKCLTGTSGRKNVLRKLLRIPYRRLKAGFFLCVDCVCLLLEF